MNEGKTMAVSVFSSPFELSPFLPSRPYCANNPKQGLAIRSQREALGFDNVQINLPWKVSALLFDVDHDQAGACWLSLGLAPSWYAINPLNNHAHIAFLLDVPVSLGDDAREQPKAFFKATLGALRYVLEADQHYSGLITKNPLASWKWSVQWSGLVYSLGELNRAALQNIPTSKLDEVLKPKKRLVDHVETPLQNAGRGERNATLFNELRAWAYQEIREFRGEKRVFSDFFRSCMIQAEMMNSIIPESLGGREVVNLAKSVSDWTFRHDPQAQALFSQRQAKRGSLGGKKSKRGKVKGSLEESKPWEAAGVSRRTWYVRKAVEKVEREKRREEIQAFLNIQPEEPPDFFEAYFQEKKRGKNGEKKGHIF